MNSLSRKINRRLFSSNRKSKILSYFADYDRQMLLYIINFKFANKINNNLDLIKETYFTNNIMICGEDGRFSQTNYKKLKPILDKKCPFNIITKIRNSNKFILLDLHYQYLIEIEQGCLVSWIETIMKPAKEGEMDGLYHQELMRTSKHNSNLKKANDGLMHELNKEVGEHLENLSELRKYERGEKNVYPKLPNPSAPPASDIYY